MKESVSGISLFSIVIVFVLLFTGYISLSINYSKAFNVKNEIISIIRNQGGVCTLGDDSSTKTNCSNFQEQIEDYFKETHYRTKGKCESGWVGFDKHGERSTSNTNVAFCVKGIPVLENSELPNALYYKVIVFWHLDIPIFSSVFNFKIDGETSRIYAPNECDVNPTQYSDWCNSW